jgi:hypothetical protein
LLQDCLEELPNLVNLGEPLEDGDESLVLPASGFRFDYVVVEKVLAGPRRNREELRAGRVDQNRPQSPDFRGDADFHSLAHLLAPDRVTVNAIAPGGTTSERFLAAMAARGEAGAAPPRSVPLGRHGTPEEMAATIAFLLGPEAAYITGATIDVNGGVWMG